MHQAVWGLIPAPLAQLRLSGRHSGTGQRAPRNVTQPPAALMRGYLRRTPTLTFSFMCRGIVLGLLNAKRRRGEWISERETSVSLYLSLFSLIWMVNALARRASNPETPLPFWRIAFRSCCEPPHVIIRANIWKHPWESVSAVDLSVTRWDIQYDITGSL